MNHFLVAVLLATPLVTQAQSYKDDILKYRQHYKEEFLTDSHSPLKGADTGYLRFYPINEQFRIKTSFKKTNTNETFQIPTHSGKKKTYKEYGTANFKIHDTTLVLHVYQSINLSKDPKFAEYLFIPFTDETNATETFGGGRYIDITISDIKDNVLVLDFNKCYNMYCAYTEGYNCPIPPKENDLKVAITAGEKLFGKKMAE